MYADRTLLAAAETERGEVMGIRIYFGPYKESPVDEIGLDERLLWLDELHYLKGYERDFWTSNPLHLDQFEPDQVFTWGGDGKWVQLSEDPLWDQITLIDQASTGQIAMTICAIRLLGQIWQRDGKIEA